MDGCTEEEEAGAAREKGTVNVKISWFRLGLVFFSFSCVDVAHQTGGLKIQQLTFLPSDQVTGMFLTRK